MTGPKTYSTRPERVEAFQVQSDNLEAVAKWCGGRVVEDPNAVENGIHPQSLIVATLDGVQQVERGRGHYIVRNLESRQFTVMEAEEFEAIFHQEGVRDIPTFEQLEKEVDADRSRAAHPAGKARDDRRYPVDQAGTWYPKGNQG